jgi:hypothetical protein
VHLGNSQSCGQLSNKYTDLDLFSSATEKEKSLHASQSEQKKKMKYTDGMLEVEIKTHNSQDHPTLC